MGCLVAIGAEETSRSFLEALVISCCVGITAFDQVISSISVGELMLFDQDPAGPDRGLRSQPHEYSFTGLA